MVTALSALLVVLLQLTAPWETPPPTPTVDIAAELYECAGIPTWVNTSRLALVVNLTAEELRVVEKWIDGEITYETARPSEARILSDYTDAVAGNLEAIPNVPYAVKTYHAAQIRYYGNLASGYNAVANGNLLSARAYAAEEADIDEALDRGWTYANLVCDGSLEELTAN